MTSIAAKTTSTLATIMTLLFRSKGRSNNSGHYRRWNKQAATTILTKLLLLRSTKSRSSGCRRRRSSSSSRWWTCPSFAASILLYGWLWFMLTFAAQAAMAAQEDNEPNLYDVIIVGAGGGGCPLAQTLVDEADDLKVLLLERGSERPEYTNSQTNVFNGLRDERCSERIVSEDGVILAAGNCMGGGTSINLGIWIEETPQWIQQTFSSDTFATTDEILDSYTWLRERVAPDPRLELTTSTSTYIQGLTDMYSNSDEFLVDSAEVQPQSSINETHVWRGYSIFDENGVGVRKAADTLLDRSNPNLEVWTNAQVNKILFDGDDNIPEDVVAAITVGNTDPDAEALLPTARCVQFANDKKTACVKSSGRIYISAGAIHTPELLLKSGIGDGSGQVENDQVGANLVDKLTLLFMRNFMPDFDYDKQQTIAHVTAPKTVVSQSTGKSSMVLFEEVSYGLSDGGGVDNAAIQAVAMLPTSLRDSIWARIITIYGDYCYSGIGSQFSLLLCKPIKDLTKAGCDARAAVSIGIIGEPTSRGRVWLEKPKGGIFSNLPFISSLLSILPSWLGGNDSEPALRVSVGYLSTTEDVEYLGSVARTMFHILTSVQGEAGPERPCSDNNDPNCDSSTSCPAMFKRFTDMLHMILHFFAPTYSEEYPKSPESIVYPNHLEKILKDNSDDDDLSVGEALRESILSVWHYAGTASVGKVVDERFKVYGVEGLYVADASVMPHTSRGNAMATAMLMGRLAGLRAVEEMTAAAANDRSNNYG